MTALDILPRLRERGLELVCCNLTDRASTTKYRVPVGHRRLGDGALDPALLAGWPDHPSFRQLKALLLDTGGLTLFAPELWDADPDGDGSAFDIAALGAIIVLPPEAWQDCVEDIEMWEADFSPKAGEGLRGQGMSVADVQVFAKVHNSPTYWLLVKNGPLQGKIFRWCHAGDTVLDTPWASDLIEWGTRIWAEAPGIFEGVIRYDPSASPDEVPPNAQLYPETLASTQGGGTR